MDQRPSEKITKFLIIFVVAVVVIKNLSGSGFFEPKNYKAKGFAVMIPEGWSRVKQPKGAEFPHGTEFAQLAPKEFNNELVEPPAIITLFSKRLTTPIWIEDEFPDIVQGLREAGYTIKDKGQIEIDNRISGWVVYYDESVNRLILEFYIVTENNIFIKLQYAADPDQFKIYRSGFEQMRQSFKFRFSL